MLKPTLLRWLLAASTLAVIGMDGFAASARAADAPPLTAATLVDRAMIEDLLVDYYARLGSDEDDFSRWYVTDGAIDVNGLTGKGKAGIAAVYKTIAEQGGMQGGTFRMVLTNVKIVVNGSSAVADCLWTGVLSETVTAIPQVVEQGREHDELMKQNGKWLFKNRIITSDGGMNPALLKTYKKR